MTARWTLTLNQRALWFFFWLTQAFVLLTSSYDFYHVNSYKVTLALACAVLLAPLIGFAAWQKQLATPPLHIIALALLPLATTVPGWIIERGRWNYLAGEQLAQWLVILLWAWVAYALAATRERVAPAPTQTTNNKGRRPHESSASVQTPMPAANRGLEHVVTGLHYLAGISALVALIDVATKGFDLLTVGNGLRATGSYGNPNYLAAFLLLALPVASLRTALGLHDFKKTPRRSLLLLDITTLALIISALLLTQTRLAQMLTAGCLLLFGLLWIYSHQRARAISLSLGLLTAAAIGILGAWQMKLPWLLRFERLLSGHDFSARLVPWQAALGAFGEAPWFGHGPGSYYALFFRHADPQSRAYWSERSFIHPHNALLDAAVEGGIFGVAGYVIFWGAALWMLWRGVRRSDAVRKPYFAALLAGLCIYLVYSQFDVTYRMITVTLPCLLALAAAAAAAQPACMPHRAIWTLWPVALVAAWLVGLPMLQSKHRMMEIELSLKGQPRIDALVALRDGNPNVYASERLLYAAIAQKNWPVFFTTARALERQIPNFRVTRHLIATAFAQRGDLRNALKAALDFQSRDRYYGPNNRLLTRIALATDDQDQVLRQLSVALEYALKEQQIIGKNWQVHVTLGNKTRLDLDADNRQAGLVIEQQTLTNLLKLLTDFYDAPDRTREDQMLLLMALMFKNMATTLPQDANFQAVLRNIAAQIL